MQRARLHRGRDAHAHPLHPGGRPRLPRARPAAARLLVRPAAEPAAVQAAAHGRRHRALLPDRPLLPRRRLPRRPAAGVHPARHRDELRRAGRRHRAGRGDRRRPVVGAGRPRDPPADPAAHLRRGDGPLRLGQAGPAVRGRAHRPHRVLLGHPVPRLPGSVRRCRGDAGRGEPAAPAVRRLAGVGPPAGCPRAGLRDGRRRRHARRSGGQEPVGRRARRSGQGRRRRAGRCDLLRRRAPRGRARAPRCRARGDRPPVRARRRERLVVRVGRGRPHVRTDPGRQGQRAGLDGRAPPVHLAERPVDRPVRGRPGERTGLRLRHRLQRQRDRRRVDPYPPLGRAGAGVRAARDGRARAAGEVRLPARRVPVRAAAARRDRVRLGPHLHAARRRGLAARGDRVPEDGQRLRPAHLGTGADHAGAAPRGGGRRHSRPSGPAEPPTAPDVAAPS